ncbi:hypothetical protein FHS82_004154 [Pseudochelatococcus lubricantis]|uniref:Uncharacterized protein n=1 Tax=Pseudochelatococcus lubricantis TaxID=1538102 RepID=A0ABX0V749_9HYPH|nr:hypothetical protein [Pseudochelatococcus lubricantis]NIJ60284.1 hypothetical protein [Pseudochelatococcus lubricantis]
MAGNAIDGGERAIDMARRQRAPVDTAPIDARARFNGGVDVATAGSSRAGGRVYARAMPVSRGLYALRYIAAEDGGVPPKVVASFAPDSDPGARLFYGPDNADGVLRAPGDALVVSVASDSVVVVTIFVEGAARNDGVKLKLDRLDRVTDRDESALRQSAGREAGASEALPVFMSGHIAYRGDVTTRTGEWLGEPSAQEDIEGFSVHWPRRPIGVDIGYGCEVAGLGEVPETLTGDFVGTRKRMLPVVSISFRLRDEKAEQFDLELEAAFRDGSLVKVSGREVSARARDGVSPLVGVRLLVRKLRASDVEGKGPNGVPAGIQSGRVKLYRGSSGGRLSVAGQGQLP